MGSIPYNEVQRIAKDFDYKLLATHQGFVHSVLVVTFEGSTFLWHDAFAHKIQHTFMDETRWWYLIFTEHYGYHIFPDDEIQNIFQFDGRIEIEELPRNSTRN
jgi:hypothetical protein